MLDATESPAMARVTGLVAQTVPKMLQDGFEPRPHLVVGLAEEAVVSNLPPDKRAWSSFILELASVMDAGAVAVVFSAWLSKNTSVAPSEASDRRNVAWVSLVDRIEASIRDMGGTYSLDPNRKEGTAGRIFDIQPYDMPADTSTRSLHLDPLVEFWGADRPSKRRSP